MDFVNRWSEKTGIAVFSFLLWIGLATSKWPNRKGRYGKVNEHNAWIPRDHWLDEAEKIAIVSFHAAHPVEAYRRLTFMMLDAIAKDFKEFIRICGMTHVRTSAYYPQSNGKIERWHRTIKGDCIRRQTPLSLEDAQRIVAGSVAHYNNVRLHSAIGYITPKDKLEGREKTIFAERDRKLEAARERRKARRRLAHEAALESPSGQSITTVTERSTTHS